jgi:hypothetical protein
MVAKGFVYHAIGRPGIDPVSEVRLPEPEREAALLARL